MKNKIVKISDLAMIRKNNPNKIIVHCHGVFDLLHHGHFLHLNKAREIGDITVVTITSDRYVNKGPDRPYFNADKRAFMLASLEQVDYVSINDASISVKPIKSLSPDYYLKGYDYSNIEEDRTGGISKEKMAVESVGGKIIFSNDLSDSSTKLLNKYFLDWDEEQQKTIGKIRKKDENV